MKIRKSSLLLLHLTVICQVVFAQTNHLERQMAASPDSKKDTIAVLSLLALGKAQSQFDIIVIGSGPGGYVAAIRSAPCIFHDRMKNKPSVKAR